MIKILFQEMIDKMASVLGRTFGIIDRFSEVIACTDSTEIGKFKSISFQSISTSDFFIKDSITYMYFGDKTDEEFAIFIAGDDDFAFRYSYLLSVTLTTSVRYYNQNHSRLEFIKNLIFDNILPGDIVFKAKSLKFLEKVGRVCLLVRFTAPLSDVCVLDVMKRIFPDASKDFVISISDSDIAIIKEFSCQVNENKLEELASSITNTLSVDYNIKSAVGVGSIARTLNDLPASFRCAQVALEVRKVFENEKNIAIYSQLGIARLIYQLPVALCKVFLSEVFKKCPIDSIDHDLMFTIHKFFENSLNISETARKLFVHRNTLVYRIDKIKKVTGL
ncbi:MAG: helix-turn-helix domain-containing protein, partial [Firmicutes bacterium]|nr:helix-turn-helix domain-containing protein [Bacillota bacterium]